jgi:hypothetical protein
VTLAPRLVRAARGAVVVFALAAQIAFVPNGLCFFSHFSLSQFLHQIAVLTPPDPDVQPSFLQVGDAILGTSARAGDLVIATRARGGALLKMTYSEPAPRAGTPPMLPTYIQARLGW